MALPQTVPRRPSLAGDVCALPDVELGHLHVAPADWTMEGTFAGAEVRSVRQQEFGQFPVPVSVERRIAVEIKDESRLQTGRVRFKVVKDFSARNLTPFVAETVAAGARVITNGWDGQRQRHVVMPADPAPHLVVRQPRLALRLLERLLDLVPLGVDRCLCALWVLCGEEVASSC